VLRGGHEGGGLGVVEEARERLVGAGPVAAVHRGPGGHVVVLPLDDPGEEGVQVSEPHPEGRLAQELAAVAGSVGQLLLVCLDVLAGDVGDLGDGRVGSDQGCAELAQGPVTAQILELSLLRRPAIRDTCRVLFRNVLIR